MRLKHICTFFLAVAVLTAGELPARQTSDWHKDADAVVLLDHTEFEIYSQRKAVQKVHRIIQINNEQGRDYGRVVVYEDKFQRCKKLLGKLLDAQGKLIRTTDSKDIQKAHYSGDYVLYSDSKYQWFDLSYKSCPYIIDYKYEVEYNTLFEWPSWQPQEDNPVLKSEYILTMRRPVRFRTYSIGLKADSLLKKSPDGKTFTWRLNRIEPRIKESYLPPENRLQMALLFAPTVFNVENYPGSLSSWEKFAAWYRNLEQGASDLPPEAVDQIKKLVKDPDDNMTKIRKIYSFLQAYTRYVAIELGIGGWKPHSARWVYQHKFGDCKDLSNFMIAMLKEVGIKAYPALTLTRDKGMTLKDFPNGRFNHCITFIPMPKDTVWVDGTVDRMAANDLPPSDEGVDVLVVKDDGGELVRTPLSSAEQNFWVSRVEARIVASGRLFFKGEIRSGGNQAAYFRGNLAEQKPEEQKNWMHHLLSETFPDLTLESFTATNLVRNYDQPVDVKFEGVVNNYATGSAHRIFFNPNILNRRSQSIVPDETKRVFPVHLSYAYQDVDSVKIELPAGYALEAGPKPGKIQTDFGAYETRYRVNGHKLTFYRFFRLNSRHIPVKEYAKFKSFFKTVANNDGQIFVFKSTL